MPKIQTYQDQIGTRLPQQQRNPASFAGLDQGAQAFSRLATIGAKTALQVQQNQRTLKISNATTQASMELEDFVFNMKNKDREYDTQFERYETFAKELSKRYAGQFEGDEQAIRVLQSNLGQLAFKRGMEVRSHALNGQMDVQKGELVSNLESLSQLAIQGDEEQQQLVRTQVDLLLDSAEQGGVVGAEERVNLGLKFQDDAASAQVRYDILTDPDKAAENLLNGKYGVSNEASMQWLEKANSASESRLRAKLAEEDRARREEERAEKKIREETAKAGDQLLYTGGMSAEWLEANKDDMDQADYRFYYKQIASGDDGFTDADQYANLRFRASEGEDVRGEARDLLRKGQLNLPDYEKLVSRSEQNLGSKSVPNWFKAGEKYLSDTFRVSDLNPDPASNQRRATVLDEWSEWATKNPNPTREEAREAYQALAKEYSLINTSEMTLMMRMPKYAVGNRSNLDIGETQQRTVEAFHNKEITPEEFKKQAALLKEWERIMGAQTSE